MKLFCGPRPSGSTRTRERFINESVSFMAVSCSHQATRRRDVRPSRLRRSRITSRPMPLRGSSRWTASAGFGPSMRISGPRPAGRERRWRSPIPGTSWRRRSAWTRELLQATVDRYNVLCEQGRDADFVKDPRFLMPLRTPALLRPPWGPVLPRDRGRRQGERADGSDRAARDGGSRASMPPATTPAAG